MWLVRGRKFTLFAWVYDFATHVPLERGTLGGRTMLLALVSWLWKMAKCKLSIYWLLRQPIYCPVSTELELAFFAQKRQFVFQTEKT